MSNPNPLDGAQEIQQMLVDYAKQETIDPLKTLGRYLGFGLAGSLLIFLGAFFSALGVLRLSQSFETFDGGGWLSTIPYLITIAVLVLFLLLIFLRLSRARNEIH